ncbi:tol-pal system protein YbgF [Alkalilimnicola ehrlichii MLHE-1]|nr:tol-pal system protein YbgF [Alkalilimnicola ehrlichii]
MQKAGKRLMGMCVAAALAAAVPLQAQALEDRVERLERRLESSTLINMANDLERLKQENRELRGQVEELSREVRQLRERQQDHYLDLDERLQELARGAPAPAPPADTAIPVPDLDPAHDDDPDTAAVPVPDIEDETPTTPADTDARSEADRYQAAFQLITEGRFRRAGQAFEALLDDHPDGEFSANARYWLAETWYAEREFDRAGEEFERLLADHPDSNKAADAKLKLGFVRFEQERYDEARELLQATRNEHRGTTAASLAEQRLELMRERGL